MRVTSLLLVRSIQRGFRRYALRKVSVRSTQKFCYIVSRHQFLLQKCPFFIRKHNTHDIQSQVTLKTILLFSIDQIKTTNRVLLLRHDKIIKLFFIFYDNLV